MLIYCRITLWWNLLRWPYPSQCYNWSYALCCLSWKDILPRRFWRYQKSSWFLYKSWISTISFYICQNRHFKDILKKYEFFLHQLYFEIYIHFSYLVFVFRSGAPLWISLSVSEWITKWLRHTFFGKFYRCAYKIKNLLN